MPARVDVVVRCKNEMPHVVRTLDALGRMDGVRVLFVDSGSTDGSLEVAMEAGVDVVRIAPEAYVPGRVLNDAMGLTSSDVVAFVNADAVPLELDAVARLVDACRRGAAAAFGRQEARADARPLTAIDHARAFPGEPHPPELAEFFSMAASAIRRDVWEAVPFDAGLKYSEDVDWTMRLRALGFEVEYVAEAGFEHSHDYDPAAMRKRMRGEGTATAILERRAAPRPWKDLLRPFAGRLARDAKSGVLSPSSARLRWEAERGRFEGLAEGAQSSKRGLGIARAEHERFTAEGRPEHEALVASIVDQTRAALDASLGVEAVALVLVGSFGAGEGVVRTVDGAPRIDGDVDLVVLVKDDAAARRLRVQCAQVSASMTERAGAHVDVWPVALDALSDPRGRLMWIDAAIRGARLVAGSPDALRPLDGLGARAVAAEEIGRLLANRATGLALSRLALEAGAHDPRAAARHAAKAWLAAGDALLLLVDCYSGSLPARASALATLARTGSPVAAAIADGYAWAVESRSAPTAPSLDADELVDHATRLWRAHAALESRRLRAADVVGTPEDYAVLHRPLYADLADVPAAGRLLAGARAAVRGLLEWRRAARHPRDTLARASVLLAFSADRGAARSWVARALKAQSDAPRDVERALVALREAAA